MSKQQRTVEVTFEFGGDIEADSVAVVGEFNDWSEIQGQMTRFEDGSFRLTVPLAVGRRYAYRFLVDGEKWMNDWRADAYVGNIHGGEDSVVDLTEGQSRLRSSVEEDERAVSTVPLDTEDGGTVVLQQQNQGGYDQVGGGEFKNSTGRTIEQAAAEQRALEHDAPIDPPKTERR